MTLIKNFQRFELKYFIDKRIADKLIIALLDHMDWDEHCTKHNQYAYFVSSLYFDSAGFGCYYQKNAGIRNRVKLRIRYYQQNPQQNQPVFLEIKRKRNMVIVKDRIKLSLNQVNLLIKSKNSQQIIKKLPPKDKNTASEFFWLAKFNCMTPIIDIAYDRRALSSPNSLDFRVTFDFNLRYCPNNWINNKPKKLLPQNISIMEVKFNNVVPSWFHSIIQKYQLQRSSFSKYANCLRQQQCYSYLS